MSGTLNPEATGLNSQPVLRDGGPSTSQRSSQLIGSNAREDEAGTKNEGIHN